MDLVQLVSDSEIVGSRQSVLGRPCPPRREILSEVRAHAAVDVDRAFRRRHKAFTSESPESMYLRKTSGRSFGSLSIPVAPPAKPSNTQTVAVHHWREVQNRFVAMSLSMAVRRKLSTQVGAERVTVGNENTRTRTAESGSAVFVIC